MNKNEILKKAQEEKNDELQIQIRDKSIKWTYATMVLAAFVFSIVRSYQGFPIMDLPVTVFLSVFVGKSYRYVKTKEKGALFMAALTLVLAVISLIRYFMGH